MDEDIKEVREIADKITEELRSAATKILARDVAFAKVIDQLDALKKRTAFQQIELTKLNRAIRKRNNKLKNLRNAVQKLRAELGQGRPEA